MRDFLNNIAAKGLSLTEGIQPRLSSRFEPAPASRGEMAAQSGFDVVTSHEEHPANEITRRAPTTAQLDVGPVIEPRTTAPNITPAADLIRKQPDGDHPTVARRAVEPPDRLAPVPAQIAKPILPVAPARPDYQLIEQRELSPSDQPTLTPAAARDLQESPLNSVEPRNFTSLEEIARRIVDERIDSLKASRPRAAEQVQPALASVKPPMPVAATIRQHHSQATAGPAAEGPQSFAAEPPPAVQITIGRIDVKAVINQPNAARRATESQHQQHQPLSLADYLKQRNGGR